MITKLTIKTYIYLISFKKLFSHSFIYNSFRWKKVISIENISFHLKKMMMTMMMINFGLEMMPADGYKNCMHCHSILKRSSIFWCNVLVHWLTWLGCLIDFVLSTHNFYPVFNKYIKKTNLFQSACAVFSFFARVTMLWSFQQKW